MKEIRHGFHKWYEEGCKNCEEDFVVTEEDVLQDKHTQVYFVICPYCDEVIYINNNPWKKTHC